MRKQYTDEQREQLIAEVRATGEKVRVVAARLGVGPSTAYHWMKEAAAPESAPVFARVVPSRAATPSSLVIELGRATVRVEIGFDPELLRNVIAALS
jgi:transposase-like protein